MDKRGLSSVSETESAWEGGALGPETQLTFPLEL